MRAFISRLFPGLKYYTYRQLLLRILWFPSSLMFKYVPRHLYEIRNVILRLNGAEIGCDVKIYPDVVIMNPHNLVIRERTTIGWGVRIYALGKITIGMDTVISQYVHICAGTHDYINDDFPLLKKDISIGNAVWIAADAFIGPGVKIGDHCVIGARSVVIRSVNDNSLVAGNPAKLLKNI